jgi:hypothetical protein
VRKYISIVIIHMYLMVLKVFITRIGKVMSEIWLSSSSVDKRTGSWKI